MRSVSELDDIEIETSKWKQRICGNYEKTISGLWEKFEWPNEFVIGILGCGMERIKNFWRNNGWKLNSQIQEVHWN